MGKDLAKPINVNGKLGFNRKSSDQIKSPHTTFVGELANFYRQPGSKD
jgi:hypothetical protein